LFFCFPPWWGGVWCILGTTTGDRRQKGNPVKPTLPAPTPHPLAKTTKQSGANYFYFLQNKRQVTTSVVRYPPCGVFVFCAFCRIFGLFFFFLPPGSSFFFFVLPPGFVCLFFFFTPGGVRTLYCFFFFVFVGYI